MTEPDDTSDTASAAEPAAPTRLAETHSAYVLLVGDRVYKWKKPVDFGFLDFSSRPQREQACARELELNRRLAPDVYLDVATLHASDGSPIEHTLVMRRLPDERRLSALVAAGEPVDDCLRDVARQVASLHGRTRTADAVEPASRDALQANWEDNLEVLRAHAGAVVDGDEVERAAQLARDYLAGRDELFAARAELACDGHGDLLADDIFCLDDGPRIIDCLDFADRLRMGDPLLDAAFLAMDLERLGRRDLATSFLAWYGEFSGEPRPATLVDHYVAYRAHVRAKVACLRADQGEEAAADQARALHALCVDRLLDGQVALVAVGGLPGTGKSTVAAGIAEARGWSLLSTDAVRKELAGAERTERMDPEHYTLAQRGAVYQELLDRADHLLGRGEPVVLDASWSEPEWREAGAELARRRSARWVPVRCETPLAVAHDRIRRRAAQGGSASDAGPEVLDQLAARTPPWPEAIHLDATGAPDAVAARAAERVSQHLRQGG